MSRMRRFLSYLEVDDFYTVVHNGWVFILQNNGTYVKPSKEFLD